MADEYRITLPKQPQGGFSESPDQTIGNSGSPLLDKGLSIRTGIMGAVGYAAGKQVFNAGFTATVGQIGSSRLEEGLMAASKVAGYIALGIATGGTVAILAASAEAISIGITRAVENHAIDLDNVRTRATRGTLINFNAGGYYG